MNSSKRKLYSAGLAVIIAWLATAPVASASEKSPSKSIVLKGTVGSISQVDPQPPLFHAWGVYFNVEKVIKG